MFAVVCGEQMSAKNRWSSSHTRVDPRGERFGEPSAQTDAWNESFCSSISRFMSSGKDAIAALPNVSDPRSRYRLVCDRAAVKGYRGRLHHGVPGVGPPQARGRTAVPPP